VTDQPPPVPLSHGDPQIGGIRPGPDTGHTQPPPVSADPWVTLAPTLSDSIAQRYVLMHYGLGEPRLDAAAIAGHFRGEPLTAEEARIISVGWKEASPGVR